MKAKRLAAWIKYSCFLLFVLLLFFFTDAYVFFLLSVLLLILPLLSLLLFRLQTRQLQIELKKQGDTAQIRLHNPSSLGNPPIHLQLVLYNRFTKKNEIRFLTLKEDTGGLFQDISLGVIDVVLQQVLAKDVLGLFCKRWHSEAALQLLRVPSPMTVPINHHTYLQQQKLAGSWQDKHEVRDYQPGDSLRWIHHKLSYKSGKLMVRTFENDVRPHCMLFLDLSASFDQDETIIASYQSICAALLKAGASVTIRWYSEERLCSCVVSDREQLNASLYRILSIPCANAAHALPQAKPLGEGICLLDPLGGDGHAIPHA